jgi:hypothetical protein
VDGDNVTREEYLALPERKVPWDTWSLRIHLHQPAACNMRPACPYCFLGPEYRKGLPSVGMDKTRLEEGLYDLAECYGPICLSDAYGEPMADRWVVSLLSRLARRHWVTVNSNLLAPPDEWSEFPRNGNTNVAASYHPHKWPVGAFLRRKHDLEASGLSISCVGIVAYPPYLAPATSFRYLASFRALAANDWVGGWLEELRKEPPGAHLLDFRGLWGGRRYPSAYTEEERHLIHGEMVATFGTVRSGEPTKGRLCWAGAKYVSISHWGTVHRCGAANTQCLGDLNAGNVELLTEPTPCGSEVCACPDLWVYMEEEPSEQSA